MINHDEERRCNIMINGYFYPQYPSYEDVHSGNQNYGLLLKDVRRRFNIWRDVRPGFLGQYFPEFERLFYLKYDYYSIAYDSPEMFAHMLAANLEELEPAFLARYKAIDTVINPFVNTIIQRDNYSQSRNKGKNYTTANGLADAFGESANTNQSSQVAAEFSDEISQGRLARDTRQDSLTNNENISDTHDSGHVLNRETDSPQDSTELGLLPAGWVAVSTAGNSEPDVDADEGVYMPLPWNQGYLTKATLAGTVQDTHNTTAASTVSDTTTGERQSSQDSSQTATASQQSQQGTDQAMTRNQSRTYADTQAVNAAIADQKGSLQEYGLSGKTVGEVWREWSDQVEVKNITREFLRQLKTNFVLIYN